MVTRLLLNENEESVEGVAVIAGHASPEEQAILPGAGELASIAIFGVEPDGGATLVVSSRLLQDQLIGSRPRRQVPVVREVGQVYMGNVVSWSCLTALEVHVIPGHCERGGLSGLQDAVPPCCEASSY